MAFVLDSSVSSVALAWMLPDEGNTATDALLDQLAQEGVTVPPIWPLEVGTFCLLPCGVAVSAKRTWIVW